VGHWVQHRSRCRGQRPDREVPAHRKPRLRRAVDFLVTMLRMKTSSAIEQQKNVGIRMYQSKKELTMATANRKP
jgi:hypothetical protein